MANGTRNKSSQINPELIYKTIREEILDQKRCQFQLLSLAVTVTAAVLAYASTGNAEASIYIAPIAMNVLAIIIIFDKAVSFQRKVGYLQMMEANLNRYKWMWETQLDKFRSADVEMGETSQPDVQVDGQSDDTIILRKKKGDPPRKQSYMTTVGILLNALNLICIYLIIVQLELWNYKLMCPIQWIDLFIAASLLIYGALTFCRKRAQLIWGEHSGPQIKVTWESVLAQWAINNNSNADSEGKH